MIDRLSRRGFLGAIAAACCVPARLSAAGLEIRVFKNPDCGCCSAWIAILEAEGFQVQQANVGQDELNRFKAISGVTEAMASCHTALVEGYVVEGHVPVAEIYRLLTERPDAVGLSVPGMPYGSPGMGPEAEREAYDVMLMRRDGSAEVYRHYEAA